MNSFRFSSVFFALLLVSKCVLLRKGSTFLVKHSKNIDKLLTITVCLILKRGYSDRTIQNLVQSNNFLIADKSLDIAVVESAPQKSVVRRPIKDENYIYITNQFITDEMKSFDIGDVEWSKSLERYNGLKEHLSSVKEMNLEKAKGILSNKCVCLDLRKEKFGTIWSVVANLNELKIERAETKPKLTNYKPETRLDWWLKKRSK